jgi:hypothetical protein
MYYSFLEVIAFFFPQDLCVLRTMICQFHPFLIPTAFPLSPRRKRFFSRTTTFLFFRGSEQSKFCARYSDLRGKIEANIMGSENKESLRRPIKFLGQGAFGVVFAPQSSEGELVAVKKGMQDPREKNMHLPKTRGEITGAKPG